MSIIFFLCHPRDYYKLSHCITISNTFFHELNREYVRIFLHPIGVSLTESFNLISNVWHVMKHMKS